jgi:hypothetical protein
MLGKRNAEHQQRFQKCCQDVDLVQKQKVLCGLDRGLAPYFVPASK